MTRTVSATCNDRRTERDSDTQPFPLQFRRVRNLHVPELRRFNQSRAPAQLGGRAGPRARVRSATGLAGRAVTRMPNLTPGTVGSIGRG
eukprot:182398-Hanusia_phi.AAC.1